MSESWSSLSDLVNEVHTHRACYGLNCVSPPPNSYVEALTLSVTVFGDRAYRDVIKIKCGHMGGGPDPVGLMVAL